MKCHQRDETVIRKERILSIPNAYEGYSKWKRWDPNNWGSFPKKKAREFRLLAGTEVKDLRLLEVGFGKGSFLAWAKSSGAYVFGVEKEPLMLAAARERGFSVSDNLFRDFEGQAFDLIVAFDVLEHLTVDEIDRFFDFVSSSLNIEGTLVIKVPNGACPFALGMQNGDLTHLTCLTVASLRQVLSRHPLTITRVRPHLAPLPGGFAGVRSLLQRFSRKLYSKIAEFMWDLSEENFYQVLVIDINKDNSTPE